MRQRPERLVALEQHPRDQLRDAADAAWARRAWPALLGHDLVAQLDVQQRAELLAALLVLALLLRRLGAEAHGADLNELGFRLPRDALGGEGLLDQLRRLEVLGSRREDEDLGGGMVGGDGGRELLQIVDECGQSCSHAGRLPFGWWHIGS